MIAFTEKALRLVLRDDEAKLAEMKLRVKGSDQELASILSFPPACALFEEFMRIEHAPENLYFWKSLERFEDICLRLQRQVERIRSGEVITRRIASASTGRDSPWRLKTTATATAAPFGTIRYPGESCAVDGEMLSESKSVQSIARATKHPNATPALISIQYQSENTVASHSADNGQKILHEGFAQLRDVVKAIMEQFVLEGSSNQVNLPGKLRVQLQRDVYSWLETVRHLGSGVKGVEGKNDKDGEQIDSERDMGCKMTIGSAAQGLVIPKDMFSKAKSECYMIMRKDTFARWSITDEFSNFFDNLQPLANARMSVLTDCCHSEGLGTGSTGTKAATTCFSSPSIMHQLSLLPGSGTPLGLGTGQGLGTGTGLGTGLGLESVLSCQLKLKLQQSLDQTGPVLGSGTVSRTIVPFVGAANRTPFE